MPDWQTEANTRLHTVPVLIQLHRQEIPERVLHRYIAPDCMAEELPAAKNTICLH